MFVCPNCSYHLPPCWKAHQHFLYAYYCRLDEFEPFYPATFVEMLKEKHDIHNVSCANPLEPGDWTFHLTNPRNRKNPRYVIMILTKFKDFVYKRGLIERFVAATSHGQEKLQPEPQKEEVLAT